MVGLVYDFGVKPILPPTRPDREHWHRDPFSRMRAYQISCDLLDNAWPDAEMLVHHRITVKVAGQLYAAVGSIQANLAKAIHAVPGAIELACSSTPLAPLEKAWSGMMRLCMFSDGKQ